MRVAPVFAKGCRFHPSRTLVHHSTFDFVLNSANVNSSVVYPKVVRLSTLEIRPKNTIFTRNTVMKRSGLSAINI